MGQSTVYVSLCCIWGGSNFALKKHLEVNMQGVFMSLK